MSFDPSQPFEVLDEPPKPAFDPSKPFDAVADPTDRTSLPTNAMNTERQAPAVAERGYLANEGAIHDSRSTWELANTTPQPVANAIDALTPSDQTAGDIAVNADFTQTQRLLRAAIGEDTYNQVAGATAETLASVAKFFATPLGVGTVGIGALGNIPKALSKASSVIDTLNTAGKVGKAAVTTGFAVHAVKNAPETISAITDAENPRQLTAALENAALNVGMVAAPFSKHGVRGLFEPDPASAQARIAVEEMLSKGRTPEDISAAVEAAKAPAPTETTETASQLSRLNEELSTPAPTAMGKETQKLNEWMQTPPEQRPPLSSLKEEAPTPQAEPPVAAAELLSTGQSAPTPAASAPKAPAPAEPLSTETQPPPSGAQPTAEGGARAVAPEPPVAAPAAKAGEGERIVAAALKDPTSGEIFTGPTHGYANPRELKKLNLDVADNPGDHIGYVTDTGRWVGQDEASAKWGIEGSETSAAYWASPEIKDAALGRGRPGDQFANPISEAEYAAELDRRLADERKHYEKASKPTPAAPAAPAPVAETARPEPTSMKRGRHGEAGAIPIPTLSPETIAALKEAGADINKLVKELREVKGTGDLDRGTMQWSRKRQQSWQEATALEHEIRAVAPRQERQAGMAVWREAGGDAATLADWESKAKSRTFRNAVKAARTLTREEQAMASRVGDKFDEYGQKAQANDILTDLRDAYIPHQWKLGNVNSGSGGRGLATSARFQKARTFATFFEGDQAGFVPKEMAVGKLLPSYVHELNSIIANREFIADLNKGKTREGLPLVTPSGRVTESGPAGEKSVLVKPQQLDWVVDEKTGELVPPDGYKVMPDQSSLRGWRWKHVTEDGKEVLMHADLALHPEAYRRVNAMIGQSPLTKWAKSDATTTVGKAARSSVLVADAITSEIKKSMFGMAAPFHQVQEGTHAIGHKILPFGHEKIDLIGSAAQRDAVENGGLMLLPERFGGSGYEEGLGGSDAMIMKGVRKLGAPGRMVANLSEQYQNYLFHDYIPRLKYATYKAALGRNMARFENDIAANKLTEGDVKMLTGEQVNAAYGHLNYALLDRSPAVKHAMRLGMLAPDFLEARVRFSGQALKSFTGSKAGREQFNAIATLALSQAALAYTVTTLTGNEWDWKHPFEAVIGDRKITLRSVPEDWMRAIPGLANEGEPRAFWTARASVPASTAAQLFMGTNYRGEKSSPEETLGDALANTLPLIIRSAPGVRDLRQLISPTSRNDPITPLEQLAGSAGLKISRHSPIRHAYTMVSKWQDANGVEKSKAVYPISKYQQLRYALEDGDFSRAQEEYDKLLEKDKRSKVREGFRQSMLKPWTGSEATDAKFRASLDDDDKALLKLAEDKRREIVGRLRVLR